MAETYIEMSFVTVGPTAHARAVEQLGSMGDVKVVQRLRRSGLVHADRIRVEYY
jgi:hypothetical protein